MKRAPVPSLPGQKARQHQLNHWQGVLARLTLDVAENSLGHGDLTALAKAIDAASTALDTYRATHDVR